MSHQDELAILQARLVTDTGDRRAAAERRIRDVEAAIGAEAAAQAALDAIAQPETTEADHSDVETAMKPKAKRR